jgi:putative addiction module component (TIGR02574 family)
MNFVGQIPAMKMTLDEIVEATRQWPPEKVGELVERLSGDLHACDEETEAAWQAEIARRIEDIQSGKTKGVPLEESLARIKKIVGR